MYRLRIKSKETSVPQMTTFMENAKLINALANKKEINANMKILEFIWN